LDRFDVLISKIILKKYKKKYHFDACRHKKHFEKQPQSHFQTGNIGLENDLNLVYFYVVKIYF
jgi:hypothetical protein